MLITFNNAELDFQRRLKIVKQELEIYGYIMAPHEMLMMQKHYKKSAQVIEFKRNKCNMTRGN